MTLFRSMSSVFQTGSPICADVLGRTSPFVRLMSSSSANTVHYKKINNNLEILNKRHNPERPRPLILLFAWMAAKGKHKKKYADFYLNKGFDVLHVRLEPWQLLLPSKAQAISRSVVDLLQTDKIMREQQLAVHTFSVGGYLYGECQVHFRSNPSAFEDVTSRIRGHIFDSPVGRRGIPEGLPKALIKNKMLLKVSSSAISWYLDTFDERVTRHYDLSEATTQRNELGVPALFLYSKADPVATAVSIDEFLAKMRALDRAPVYTRCWPDSPHVSHMLYHPQEYIAALNEFIDAIGLGQVGDVAKLNVAQN